MEYRGPNQAISQPGAQPYGFVQGHVQQPLPNTAQPGVQVLNYGQTQPPQQTYQDVKVTPSVPMIQSAQPQVMKMPTSLEMQMQALEPEHDIGTESLIVRCPHCSQRVATRVTDSFFKLTQ
jgi:hypothetical protein